MLQLMPRLWCSQDAATQFFARIAFERAAKSRVFALDEAG